MGIGTIMSNLKVLLINCSGHGSHKEIKMRNENVFGDLLICTEGNLYIHLTS